MNSDHAPTAEEQLPPLDREHTYYDPITSEDDSQCLEQTGEFEIRILREDQLLAALRENREKDAKIAELTDALWEAAQSLRTIADGAGRREFMEHMDQVRGYANSRANVAHERHAELASLSSVPGSPQPPR